MFKIIMLYLRRHTIITYLKKSLIINNQMKIIDKISLNLLLKI